MESKKPKARMGRPPVPVDKVRPHRYNVSLTHRDQYLLKKFNEKERPDLSPASYIRLLAHHMLEIMEDPEYGVSDMVQEQVYYEGVKAEATQAEISFVQGEAHTNTMNILRSPELDRMMKDAKTPKARKNLEFTPPPTQ